MSNSLDPDQVGCFVRPDLGPNCLQRFTAEDKIKELKMQQNLKKVNVALKWRLMITNTNSLDPDQDRQNVGPDLDPNRLTLSVVFLKEFFDKVNFEKSGQTTTKS